jgi:hypothetical protein
VLPLISTATYNPMNILDFFTKTIPASTQKVINYLGSSVGNFLNDTQNRVYKDLKSQVDSIPKQDTTGIDIAKSIVQGTAQSGGSVGLTLMNKPELTTEELAQASPALAKFKDILYGKDPIKSLQTRIAETQKTLETGVQTPFGKITAPQGTAKPLSMIGVLGMTALDFTGFGGEEKGALKLLAKTTKVEDVARILKDLKVADEAIPEAAKVISGLSKTEDVAKVLKDLPTIAKVAEEAKPVERAFLQSVKEARPDIPIKIGGEYIPRSTDALVVEARNLIKTNFNKAVELANSGTDDKAIATAAELIKHYGDKAAETADLAIKNAMWEKASDLAHGTAVKLTEQGRAVQAASIMGRQTPEGFLRTAAKSINDYNEAITKSKGVFKAKPIPQLTAEQTGKILEEFTKISDMADGTKKAMATKKLTDAVAEIVPTPFFQKAVSVWKAGLLTGIKTTGVNTISNLYHGVSEIVKDIPATAIDKVASLFTGERTLGLTAKGTLEGIKEGFQKGYRYLQTGFDERDIASKLDYKKISFGEGKVAKALQKYEETIFHLMGAEDQPFYYGAKARSIQSQAVAEAINKGLKGREAKSFVEKLVANPTDKMLKYAVSDAEIAVFQNQTMLGKFAKGIQKLPGGEIILPFGKTPAAVATQLINYSPVGIVKTLAEAFKNGFDQRLFSQAMGRAITGTGVMYLGTQLFKNGLITLGYPTKESEQKLWEAEGKTANSIKIGGKWRQLSTLGVGGNLIIAGANYQQALQKTGSPTQASIAASLGGVKSLKDQTFLSGVNQITNAIDNPQTSGTAYAGNLISSLIPTIVGDVAKATDTKERRTTGLTGTAKGKIPGVRETLQPQVNVLGQERKLGGNWLETMIDPTRPSNALDSNVISELRRLTDAGFTVAPTQLGDKNGYKGLTPAENTALWEKSGELMNSKLNNLFSLPNYKSLDDEQKTKIIAGIVDTAKLNARVQAVMELTHDLKGQALKDKLKELKTNGLMSKDVFNKFISLQ